MDVFFSDTDEFAGWILNRYVCIHPNWVLCENKLISFTEVLLAHTPLRYPASLQVALMIINRFLINATNVSLVSL